MRFNTLELSIYSCEFRYLIGGDTSTKSGENQKALLFWLYLNIYQLSGKEIKIYLKQCHDQILYDC